MSKRTRSKKPPQSRAKQKKRLARPTMALIDIVIPVYGEWGMCAKAIGCIEAATEGLEEEYRVIVVDNGTPEWKPNPEAEGEEAVVVSPEEQAKDVKSLLRKQKDVFVRLEDNVGYPGGCNTGASKSASPLILILTADVYMEPGSITTMVREMDDPSIGVVGPLLLFPLDESPHGPPGGVQSAGIAINIKGDPYHIFIGWTPDNPRVKQRRNMQAVTGAVFLTRRSLWEQIGGFADVYGKGTYEDMEYCFAVRSLGREVIFQPEAIGYHYVGGSIKQGAGPGGFPLGINATIWKGRWATAIQWDSFRFA